MSLGAYLVDGAVLVVLVQSVGVEIHVDLLGLLG